MTYCVGILLKEGIVLASDSRTNAGLNDFAKFCKMTCFERKGDRVIILLSSGNLAGTQAVVSLLKQRGSLHDGSDNLWTAGTMFDVERVVSDAMRDIEQRDAAFLEGGSSKFNASFILGGQVRGEPPRLFRLYSEGNFIEVGEETPFCKPARRSMESRSSSGCSRPAPRWPMLPSACLCPSIPPCAATSRWGCRSIWSATSATASESATGAVSRKAIPTSPLSSEWSAGVREAFRNLHELEW
jgi:putative proteasome-type protease